MEQVQQTEFTHKIGNRIVREYTLDEIQAFESTNKYVEAILPDGFRGILDITLKVLEKTYGDDFIRVHRGVLVRKSALRTITRPSQTGSTSDAVLSCGHVVPVSRRFATLIRNFTNRENAARIEREEQAAAIALANTVNEQEVNTDGTEQN